ncbi:GGDEF domain-containing protein [Lachnoclostridium sp. Marseille-P6806]|uniref:GGDEF domain-containing protein n=1 Tax=Lachnoclostridium sp. Marseille-P6806 TaxID=2364793 RepID=UPI0013EF42A2|nr:GGDEF domain-containing protein [Lachnoclostridium sp. Marseille-P6806]
MAGHYVRNIWRKLNPPEFDAYRADLEKENLQCLARFLIFGCLASALSLAAQILWLPLPGYGHCIEMAVYFILSLAVFFAFYESLRRNATLALYIWIAITLFWEIVHGAIFAPERETFLFFFLLLVLPFLLLDKPIRVLVLILMMSAVYAAVDIRTKENDILRYDMQHLCVCSVSSLYLNYTLLSRRLTSLGRSSEAQENAEHDPLTGICNRRGGEPQIRKLVSRSQTGAFILLDIDDFKQINDNFGHDVGDEVLKSVAAVLAGSFRDSDVVMRMGGDEFAVYALGMDDYRGVQKRLASLREALRSVTPDGREDHPVTVSVGCAINNGSYPAYDVLYQICDGLLYETKRNGKDGYRIRNSEYREADAGKATA